MTHRTLAELEADCGGACDCCDADCGACCCCTGRCPEGPEAFCLACGYHA